MTRKGSGNTRDFSYPDRKAHANLADIEGRLLEGMRKSYPGLIDPDGSCPQCVALEYLLADEYQAQSTASEMTNG
jgi:hypothetical protein